jgi:DNA-binding transcriptional LysR family regulator
LLVRGARGMVPTQHGASLLEPAKRILDDMERLFVQKTPFAPQQQARTFHIAAPDYLDSQFLPSVVAAIRRESPNSRVVIHSLGPEIDYTRLLSDGDLDLVIANWDQPPQHLHMSELFEDEIACFMRADCPYALRTGPDDMTVEDYLSLPHVAPTQMLPGYYGVIESFLARQNMHRNVVVESAYFGLIPTMLTRTNLVLTTGKQFMRFYEKNLPLKAFTVPIKFPNMRFYQLWHDRVHHAPEHKWLRDLVFETANSLSPQ